MQTTVYVDVLLVLNYIVTALLTVCTAKLLGLKTQRRKIVAAALLGSLGSLTIFLPFMGFFPELLFRLGLSAAIVLAAMPAGGIRLFIKCWAVFFAVSFFFAGVMLGIMMVFAPRGMVYYNTAVYFDISPFLLLTATIASYLLLTVWNRISRAGRLAGNRCKAVLRLEGRECALEALIDSGNSLYEPFSGVPVIVCRLEAVKTLFSPDLLKALQSGSWQEISARLGARFRLVPYTSLGGKGTLPAFKADSLTVEREGKEFRVEQVYVAVSSEPLGDGSYTAILNPDLIGVGVQA